MEQLSTLKRYFFVGLKVLNGMLFTGPLPLTKLGFKAVDAFVTCYHNESGMYCVFILHVYCFHKFSKYIPYKLSIEKQRSNVNAWGLDLQNYI